MPYTLTILPGFFISYSRIPFNQVHAALDEYLRDDRLTQVGAALAMNCLSPASFRLFYHRVCKRIQAWTILLTQLVISLGGTIEDARQRPPHRNEVRRQWAWFMLLSDQYLSLYARLPHTPVILEALSRQYIGAILNRNRMGLGP